MQNASRPPSKVNVEKGHWLLPIEDRRNQNGNGPPGLLRGLSLAGYLLLVDWSSRLMRPGKVSLPADVHDILTRLKIDSTGWKATLEKLLGPTKKVGAYFDSPKRLPEVAAERGCKSLRGITGRSVHPTTLAQVNPPAVPATC